MRWLLALLCLTFASLTQANAAPSLDGKVDKVLVLKSERETAAPQQRQRPEKLPCLAGQAPDRPKLAEGDNRTPEGFYWIDWRKTSNNYNLSMHISYPNARDVAKAREKGLPAGGMIMIHGTPLDDEYPGGTSPPWTGPMAVSPMNSTDMREVWSVVKDGTLIEIRP